MENIKNVQATVLQIPKATTPSSVSEGPKFNPDRIPAELKGKRNWVLWRLEAKDGRKAKVPYQTNGSKASTSDRGTWATFEDCLTKLRSSGYSGLGFMFSKEDGLVGVDLDHHVDTTTGQPDEFARRIIATLSSYTERSQSGTGWHIICRGVDSGGKGHRKAELGLEAYTHGRYFVMTGDHLEGTPLTVEPRQNELTQVLGEFFPEAQSTVQPVVVAKPDNEKRGCSDERLIQLAQTAVNGPTFKILWEGRWGKALKKDGSRYGSQSEADLALLAMLRFWTKADREWSFDLFRKSGLNREKTRSEGYLPTSWAKLTGELYEGSYGPAPQDSGVGPLERVIPAQWNGTQADLANAMLGTVAQLNENGAGLWKSDKQQNGKERDTMKENQTTCELAAGGILEGAPQKTVTASATWNPAEGDAPSQTTVETSGQVGELAAIQPGTRQPFSLLTLSNPEDERAVLGGLLGCESLKEVRAVLSSSGLTSEAFCGPEAGLVYRTITGLVEMGLLPKRNKVEEHLRGSAVESPGIRDFMAGLPSTTATRDKLSYHVDRVMELSGRRRVARLGMEMASKAVNATVPLDQVQRLVDDFRIEEGSGSALDLEFESRRIDFDNPPPESRAIYSLKGVVIATTGNLLTIAADSKAGKTAFLGAMAASAMCGSNPGDRLGCSSDNREGRPMFLFDTEQTEQDLHKCLSRVAQRAGLERPPEWFHGFTMKGMSPASALKFMQWAVEKVAGRSRKAHSIFLDGAADLVEEVNDGRQSNALVCELEAMAIERDCAVVSVIHFNPNSEKPRGHLGSQLERKSESNLRLAKEDGKTAIWSERQRGAPIMRKDAVCFAWSDDFKMHVTCDSKQGTARKEKVAKAQTEVEALFQGKAELTYSGLVERMMETEGLKKKAAQQRIARLKEAKVVVRSASTKGYVLAPG